jgi:hypothetical protein
VLPQSSTQQAGKKTSYATIEFFQLPKKYQRRPISTEEVEAINVINSILFII